MPATQANMLRMLACAAASMRTRASQLFHGLVRGGLLPQVVHHFALLAAAAGGRQQVLDDGLAARVAQVPEVLPHQLGLARVHQVLAVQVVDEEIAVVAELHLRQQFQRPLARGLVVARRRQRGDGAVGQADVMAQFAFLAGQPGAFHDLLFALGQLQALHVDSHGNGGHGHQQGDRGKQ
ncbi:hypothetical protein G6F22_008813 [Rhizopus arrhizus]|nr:hypothetical protein G6F22_008813 [Rhizopus arrhizus]